MSTDDSPAVPCPGKGCGEVGDLEDQLAPGQRRCSNESCRVVTYSSTTPNDRQAIANLRRLREERDDG